MWRHKTETHTFIGTIWGVSGFDSRFVGNPENSNQVEHLAISIALQYAYDTSVVLLNALEIRDTFNGKQPLPMTRADQAINYVAATEFLPHFEDGYAQTIERLRCILSRPETTTCV
ncbi:MAG: hypothetical protein CUN57_02035 [Phototrophicales bacterium]|nr:MAG: hypothetical protein CUN57_02035 [Phototrophicales bacterium]